MGRVRVRACSRTWEREESRTTARSTGARFSPPRACSTHQPTKHLSILSIPPSPSLVTSSPGSLCSHTRPYQPPNSLPLSLTVALNPKCSSRSLLGAIFLLSLDVSRLGQCCCSCCRRRRRRRRHHQCCCSRRRRLPRPRGLHYRVLQGGLWGCCGAWVSLCMDQEGGGGNCAALCSEDIQRGRTSPLGVRGCSVRAGRLFL